MVVSGIWSSKKSSKLPRRWVEPDSSQYQISWEEAGYLTIVVGPACAKIIGSYVQQNHIRLVRYRSQGSIFSLALVGMFSSAFIQGFADSHPQGLSDLIVKPE